MPDASMTREQRAELVNEIARSIQQEIRSHMAREDVTVKEVAGRLGIAHSVVSSGLRGPNPTTKLLNDIALAAGMRVTVASERRSFLATLDVGRKGNL